MKGSGFGLARGPLLNAFLFQVFNTSSFYLIMGLPMMLYFKKLGASATVLGVVAALGALMNIFQIPAARFVERIGYRTFVLRGWISRSFMIGGVALVVSLPLPVDESTRQILVLFILFLFNIARGISLSGYLPWISAIVPESVRGRFLSMDQAASQSALLLTVALSAVYLQWAERASAFGALFAASLILAGMSLIYLKKIPDAPVSPAAKEGGGGPVEGDASARAFSEAGDLSFDDDVGPFGRRVDLYSLCAGSVGLLRFEVHDSAFNLGEHLCADLLGDGKDVGSGGKPARAGAGGFYFWNSLVGLGAVAAHLLPFQWGTILFQQATAGVGLALYNSAHMRLLMATVPAMGRSHFFALFSVAASLVAGLAPLGWGLLTDAMQSVKFGAGVEVNRFVILYVTITLILIPAMVALRRIEEARASTTEELLRELVLETPWRSITRWWNRRPFA